MLENLERWLDGGPSRCPDLPTGPSGQADRPVVITAVCRRLCQVVSRERADLGLVRAAEIATRLNGPEWERAWWEAIRLAREAETAGAVPVVPNAPDLIMWSSLRAEPDTQDDDKGLGVIQSFAELACIRRLSDLIADYYRESGALNPYVLNHVGLAFRLKDLLRRAPDLLLNQPFGLPDLAETFPDAFAGRTDRSDAWISLHQIAGAAALMTLHCHKHKVRSLWLYRAAVQVAQSSFGIDLAPSDRLTEGWGGQAAKFRGNCFDHFLARCTTRSETDEGLMFWESGMIGACLEASRLEGAGGAIRELLKLIGERAWAGMDRIEERVARRKVRTLFDRLFAHFARLEPYPPSQLASVHLDALIMTSTGLMADSVQPGLRSELAAAFRCSFLAALQRTPTPELPALAERAAEILQTIERKRSGGEPFAIVLGQRVLERMTERGVRHRASALAILAQLERLVAAAGIRSRRFDSVTLELAWTLKMLILAWVDAPEPQPWLEPLREGLALNPIRLTLARVLGYPRCLYLGRLIDWTPDGDDHRLVASQAPQAEDLDEPAAVALSQEGRALAIGALGLWREIYGSGVPALQDQIRALLDREGPDADDALNGLTKIAADDNPRHTAAVGADCLFMVDVLQGAAPPARLGHTPPQVRAGLLDPDPETRVLDGCFALYLARGILYARRSGLTICQPFLRLLGRSGGLVRALLGECMDWDTLDDDSLRHRLDLCLFALHLLQARDSNPAIVARGGRLLVDALDLNAFTFPDEPALKARLRALFDSDSRYLMAFARARQLAGMDRLEGWPLERIDRQ